MPDSDRRVGMRGVSEVGDLVVTGKVNLQGVGKIVTSTDTGEARIVLASTGKDRLQFYSASTDETFPGYIEMAGTTGPLLTIRGGLTTSHTAGASILIDEASVNVRSVDSLTTAQIAVTTGSVLIGDDLRPSADAAYSLGATTAKWLSLYASNVYITSVPQAFTVKGNLTPVDDNSYDLGSSTHSWQDLHAYNIKDESGNTVFDLSAVNTASTYDPNLSILTGTTLPTVGSGANAREDGIYSRIGSQVQAHVTITWSSDGTAGNGVYTISPPKKIHSSLIVGGSVGAGRIIDASESDTWIVEARKAGSTSVNLRITSTSVSNVTNANPFTCGSSDDQFDINLHYLTTET